MAAVPTSDRAQTPGRLQFLLLAVLFLAPFVSAWLLYFYFPQHRPTRTTNYGELVQPLRQLPDWTLTAADGSVTQAKSLAGKWTLVQRVPAGCDEACAERVLLTRQTRTAMAADRDRVLRLLLVDDAAQLPAISQRFATAHPDLLVFSVAEAGAVDGFFGVSAAESGQTLYLIDPPGNYLMKYPDHGTIDDFKGLQKDLKKLLKL